MDLENISNSTKSKLEHAVREAWVSDDNSTQSGMLHILGILGIELDWDNVFVEKEDEY
ncbi:hypothetical protein [Oceanobacillus jeddahense]|uniref:hypothetical protein n=1 Tax=Oceanobacillus jeddahense TaxID=1462527 RepID=UPI000A6D6862|nr:hypothetical protein [Oceanobacillus jeddahense]